MVLLLFRVEFIYYSKFNNMGLSGYEGSKFTAEERAGYRTLDLKIQEARHR